MVYNYSAAERLMRYVQIDTQSDPSANCFPSTEKQKDLLKLLTQELTDLGCEEVEMDNYGYVYATIPATTTKSDVPTICFCSHVDTAPDCSGTHVKPILHKSWDGSPIVLPDDPSQVITVEDYPYLKKRIGDDIITASGNTLLGADDKAGVAIIMNMTEALMKDTSIPHGKIRILFTPDEEVGRGVEHLDMKKLNADFGYTLDGGERGSLEGDSFSADGVSIIIHGVSAHPGYAKGKMVNALKIASDFIASLPKDDWCPEATEGDQGFVHPLHIDGIAEKVTINFIIRNHQTAKLAEYETRLENILKDTIAKYPGSRYEFHVKEQYRNMREILNRHPQVEAYAVQAMKEVGIEPQIEWIRGGTDGSRLSFMGLPCPNIFTGMAAIHSKHEHISVQDMNAAVDTLIKLVQVWERNSSC